MKRSISLVTDNKGNSIYMLQTFSNMRDSSVVYVYISNEHVLSSKNELEQILYPVLGHCQSEHSCSFM